MTNLHSWKSSFPTREKHIYFLSLALVSFIAKTTQIVSTWKQFSKARENRCCQGDCWHAEEGRVCGYLWPGSYDFSCLQLLTCRNLQKLLQETVVTQTLVNLSWSSDQISHQFISVQQLGHRSRITFLVATWNLPEWASRGHSFTISLHMWKTIYSQLWCSWERMWKQYVDLYCYQRTSRGINISVPWKIIGDLPFSSNFF